MDAAAESERNRLLRRADWRYLLPSAEPGRVLCLGGAELRAACAVIGSHVDDAIAGDGPERERLVAKAAAVGVADRVRWLGHRDDVPALLAAADLFVLPSLNEGLPLAAMEAMLAGVPIVATDAGGTGEIVRDGTTGVLVPPGDPLALSASIRALLGDRSRAARLAIAARELIEREHSAAAMVAETSRLYEELLAR